MRIKWLYDRIRKSLQRCVQNQNNRAVNRRKWQIRQRLNDPTDPPRTDPPRLSKIPDYETLIRIVLNPHIKIWEKAVMDEEQRVFAMFYCKTLRSRWGDPRDYSRDPTHQEAKWLVGEFFAGQVMES